MTNLKNINFMSADKFDSLSTIADDNLYAVQSTSFIPDYSSAVAISGGSYTPPADGIIQMGYNGAGDNSYGGGISLNGLEIASQYSAYKYSNGGTFWVIVEKGKTYTVTTGQPNIKFIPFK